MTKRQSSKKAQSDSEAKLTLTMLGQIESYLDDRDSPDEGWYYGNREQFEKRHQAIRAWLAQEIYKARKMKCKCNNRDSLLCHKCEESTGVCLCNCHQDSALQRG